MKVAWFAEDLNNDKKVCNYVPSSINMLIRSLHSSNDFTNAPALM